MHATVVVFPGSNADAEMIHTLRSVVGVHTDTAWHRDAELPPGVELVAIPGGFSYGDYLRCGAIARTSPIVAAIRRHVERGGWVLGVCNGFQILAEAGLLPGALTQNAHLRFECRDVFVTPAAPGPFTTGLPRVLRLPIAHADGRYQASDATLAELEAEGRIALRYCDASGAVTAEANPNGSRRQHRGHLRRPEAQRPRPDAAPGAHERALPRRRRRAGHLRRGAVALRRLAGARRDRALPRVLRAAHASASATRRAALRVRRLRRAARSRTGTIPRSRSSGREVAAPPQGGRRAQGAGRLAGGGDRGRAASCRSRCWCWGRRC